MINETNLADYKVQLHGISIFQRDIENIVYGVDTEGPITKEKPDVGDVPYLKVPEQDIWLKIVPK